MQQNATKKTEIQFDVNNVIPLPPLSSVFFFHFLRIRIVSHFLPPFFSLSYESIPPIPIMFIQNCICLFVERKEGCAVAMLHVKTNIQFSVQFSLNFQNIFCSEMEISEQILI